MSKFAGSSTIKRRDEAAGFFKVLLMGVIQTECSLAGLEGGYDAVVARRKALTEMSVRRRLLFLFLFSPLLFTPLSI